MPRRLKIPASELVKWHHSDITMAQRNDPVIDEIFREVDLDSKARIARHAAEEHTPQGIARKAAERERSRQARTTHNGKAPVHSDPNAKRKPRLLGEDSIEALREFADDEPRLRGYFPDSKVFGLSIFLGAKSTVWRFRQQGRNKGKRSSVFKTLGNWPAVTTDEARKEALIYSGAVAAGTAAPGKRQAMPFKTAFENYLAHLKAQAEAKGKPPRWWLNASKLSEAHIMPQWNGWTLAEMSANPRAVKTWHAKLSKSIPTTADHCARLIRACYREEARLDRTLNPAASPTSGIRLGKIKVSKAVLDFPDFSAWRKAWDKIENPVHKGYHLAALLTGCRPTELAMIRESDIDLAARRMIIRNAKAGNDISLPITGEIAFALAMAINAPPQTVTMKGLRGMKRGEVRVIERKKPHHEVTAPDLVFPGVRQAGHRSGIPVSGNALRHTFRSIAVSLEISEMLISFLMGHSLQGVSAKYTNELMIANSQALRDAQEKISRRIFELLGLTLGGNHDCPARAGRAEPARKRVKPRLRPASLETGQTRALEQEHEARPGSRVTARARRGKPRTGPGLPARA
jgi:integrase